MLWRTGLVVGFIVGAGMLAYQIGSRLSDQAMMTIVGVLCGIVASIPISIGLLIALTRERPVYDADDYYDVNPEPVRANYPVYRPEPPTPPQPPQIIVVAPPQQQLPPNFSPYGNYLMPPDLGAAGAGMQERNFKIVGDDEGD